MSESAALSALRAALRAIASAVSPAPRPHAAEPSPLFTALRTDAGEEMGTSRTFVAVLEIDRFPSLRQSIGYKIANRMLVEMAERLRQVIATAEIGRIGRTTIEFAFRAASPAAAQLQLLGAIEQIERRLEIEGLVFDLGVKIGFADAARSSIRDELIDQAEAALATGQAERVKVCFANEDVLSREGKVDLELMRALPEAIRGNELSVHYQPKLDARQDRITAAEALVRWYHPQRGLIPTDRFIKLAEETGMIRDLSEWVLARAVADQHTLAARGYPLEIAVNISAQLLPDQDFTTQALKIAAGAGHPLAFEITETAVIGDPEAAFANLRAFSAAGIKIAIDDYGSGLSSLAYLRQIPAQELKIDRVFVSGLTESNRDPLLVRSSIDLAHALDMEVTAEGVDDPMALSLLRIMGCDLLQGYYISRPVPLAALIEFLDDDSQRERLAVGAAQGPWERFGTA